MAIIATGGTTGLAKGVRILNRSWSAMLETVVNATPCDLPPVCLAAAPLTHAESGYKILLLVAAGNILVKRYKICLFDRRYRPAEPSCIRSCPCLRLRRQASRKRSVRMTHRFALFDYGFRPFFLLAGLDAAIAMTVWLCVYFDPGLWPADAGPAWLWHAHEMMFGFVPAAMGGFLLTSVPSWTGGRGFSGLPLMALVAVWFAGRTAMIPGFLPGGIAAAIDLAFFPALAAMLAVPLIRAGKLRNLVFLFLLALFFAANLAFHLGRLDVFPGGEFAGLGLAVDVMAIVVAIVAGRIIPAFTQNGLRQRGIAFEISPFPLLDGAAIAALVLVLASDMVPVNRAIAGATALLAALLHGVRLARWSGWQTRHTPLLWVLRAGYGFLVLALALKGIGLLTGAAIGAKWLHALTIGCFATMILGVTTRASLGHTGRPLVAPKTVVPAYALVPAAALVRVFAPAVAPDRYSLSIALAGGLWLMAFLLYTIAYAPILIGPRADGRPG